MLRKPKTAEDFIECPSCLHTIPKSEATVYPAGTDRKLKKIWERKLITPGQTQDTDEQSDQESIGSTCTGDGLSSAADCGSEWEYSIGERQRERRYHDEDGSAYDEGWWSKMAVGRPETSANNKRPTTPKDI